MGRDPRVNPRPGDRVRKGGVIRAVRRRNGGQVDYLIEARTCHREHGCWITTWKRWCKDAEVLDVGP